MKILSIKSLAIPEVKVIRFGRFCDARGYFSEIFRKGILKEELVPHPSLQSSPLPSPFQGEGSYEGLEFRQCNESYSRRGVVRGLHFQWEPPQSKLLRVISGKIVDLILDIRKGSPTLGKIIAYELSATPDMDFSEWLWVPAGFAHGFFSLEESMVEYFCTAEWNPQGEAGISPLAEDLDWSLCSPNLKKLFTQTITSHPLLSDKDRNGYTLQSWLKDKNSDQFVYPCHPS